MTDKGLTSFTAQMADGRMITVDAEDEESAKRNAHFQSGSVGVLSIEKTKKESKPRATSKAADKDDDKDTSKAADKDKDAKATTVPGSFAGTKEDEK